MTDRKVTASFGVTMVEQGDSVDSVLHRADTALFEAKQTGRNKTCSRTGAGPTSEKAANRPAAAAQPCDDPFTLSQSFKAVIAADMIVFKLGGFVNDNRGKLKDASPRRAVVRLGSSGLLPFWGGSEERRPVEVELIFGTECSRSQPSPSQQVEISVCIRPVGWIRDAEAFQARARRVMKSLRAYFAAG